MATDNLTNFTIGLFVALCGIFVQNGIQGMPNKILVDDIIDEMIDSIDYIKLNTYIELEKDD